MDYPKLIVWIISNFIDNEDTDYLSEHSRFNDSQLTKEELAEVIRLRNIARESRGWDPQKWTE
jgi:hypothetical protein